MEECIFCTVAAEDNDEERFILHRGRHAFIIMNRYPYTGGHVMVVPYRHLSEVEELSEDEMAEIMALMQKSVAALKKSYHPQGFNIGINLGSAAGAGVEDHVHLHVVPRWNGDTNFMSVVSGTRVIPESLESGYRKLHKYLK